MEYRADMRRAFLIAAALSAAVGSNTLAVPVAELRENYQSIIERNPFGLKPIPPPPTNNVNELKEKPKTQIFLTGITSIGYPRFPKQAYIVTQEQGSKEPKFYSLNEGDSRDGIKVLNIDPEGRKVRIQMNNQETLLSFQTHGVSATNAIARAPVLPTIPVPGKTVHQPVPLPNAGGAAYRGAQATYRQPNLQIPQPGVNTMQNGAGTALRQIPARRPRGVNAGMDPNDPLTAQPLPQQPQQPQEPAELAEEYLRMHLNRQVQEQQTGIPMPPLPPFE
mgnify:FL=1